MRAMQALNAIKKIEGFNGILKFAVNLGMAPMTI
jgi:hypothetical protein